MSSERYLAYIQLNKHTCLQLFQPLLLKDLLKLVLETEKLVTYFHTSSPVSLFCKLKLSCHSWQNCVKGHIINLLFYYIKVIIRITFSDTVLRPCIQSSGGAAEIRFKNCWIFYIVLSVFFV